VVKDAMSKASTKLTELMKQDRGYTGSEKKE
jgi:hypothetical protein